MSNIDRTKENIGVNKLDDEARKKLFNDFVSAGGKVEQEPKRSSLIIDREKQAQYKNQLESFQKSKSHTSKSRHKLEARQREDNIGFFLKIKTGYHLFFSGVTGFSAVFFKNSFFKKLLNEYRMAFEDLQKMYLYIFELNKTVGDSVTLRLDSEKPILFELIEMTSNLYEKEHFKGFPNKLHNTPETLSSYRDKFLYLMKRVCVLKPYENAIFNSYLKALEYYVYYANDKSKFSEYRHRIKSSLFLIFDRLYPQLYWLTVRYTGYDPKYDFSQIYQLLSIPDNEKPGIRVVNKADLSALEDRKSDKSDDADNVDDADADDADKGKDKIEKEIEDLSDGIKLGLKLMGKINTANLIAEFDRDKLFVEMDENDKTFKAFVLFAEFEKEYSFILSSNKVKYNVYFTSSGKIDYGKQLQDIYNLMQKPWVLFKDFRTEQQSYELLSQDKPAGNQQYMIHINKLKEIEKSRDFIGRNARGLILGFLEKLYEILQQLRNDLDDESKLISNPQETLVFDTRIEGVRKLAGVKVFEAINLITAYVEAFLYRLSRNGDLYGLSSIEGKPQETVIDRIISNDHQASLKALDSSKEPSPSEDKKLSEDIELPKDLSLSEDFAGLSEDLDLSLTKKDSSPTESSSLPEASVSSEDTKKKPSSDGSIFDELDDLL